MTPEELRRRFDLLLSAVEIISNGFDEGDTEDLFGVRPAGLELTREEMIAIADAAIKGQLL